MSRARGRRKRRFGPRSLKNKLALLFFLITAAAFAVLFFIVVPQLESRLVDRELDDLERASAATLPELRAIQDLPEPRTNELVRRAADDADAVVTLLSAQFSGTDSVEEVRPFVISDSRARRAIDEPLDIAERVFLTQETETDTVTLRGERFALVARPIRDGREVVRVAVYSRSIGNVTDSVELIRTQVILATALALLVALAGGYLVAQALSRRVRRLEDAARRVAAGHFPGPLPVDADDELGQLTSTFNAMQKQLAQVDRARKEFIATASHELRTPIMSLGGFVELLLDEDIDPATREEFLHTMREQVERLQKLSVDLLDLSRLDSGAVTLNPERVDLAQLARAVAEEFTPATRDRPGEVRLELGNAPVAAVCDRERTARIMRILLDNALRHTPAGTPVTVTAGSHDGLAGVSVADRGPGLDPGDASRVFDRFYTADAGRGSGLGLAIAKELAELMEGSIAVRSHPGETVFTVDLPAAR
jgi:two-component system, OmpR family, sensor kinase